MSSSYPADCGPHGTPYFEMSWELPHAIVFGETERWAKVFASLGSAGGGASVMPSFGWYTGVHPWTYATFGSSIASFSVNTRAPFRRPPRTRRAGSEAGEGSREAASAKVGAEAGDAGPRV
jgi:hypothetical protein